MDSTVLLGILTLVGTIVTVLTGAFVSTRTNRTEKKSAALLAMEAKQAELDQQENNIWQMRLDLKQAELDQALAKLAEEREENERLRRGEV